MATYHLSSKAKEIAGLVVRHQRTQGKLMVSLLEQIYTDIGGRGYSPADSRIAAIGKKLLQPVMVQPGRLGQATFNSYFTWARKCMIFGVTWADAMKYGADEIREAIRRASERKRHDPDREIRELVAEELEATGREKKRLSKEERTARKLGPKPVTLNPVVTPKAAKRWVKDIAAAYANFDLATIPDDEEGKLVRNFIAGCVSIQQGRRKPEREPIQV